MPDSENATQNQGIVTPDTRTHGEGDALVDQRDDTDFEDRLLHSDEGSKGSSSRDPGAGKPMGGVSDAERFGHAPSSVGSVADEGGASNL